MRGSGLSGSRIARVRRPARSNTNCEMSGPRWARASICGSLQVGGAEVPEVVASEIVEHHHQNIRTILGGRAPQEW